MVEAVCQVKPPSSLLWRHKQVVLQR
jgi:hypothetical protein